ncbi:MAG: family HAD-type hydrolase [Devosia sp.]|nr:family HAD-type hydrolase [Devosia sp.]
MQALAGLSGIAPRYDVVLSDIWGVVHNGVAAHPTAVEALVNYRRNGGRVVLISNAPRPHGPIIEMMDPRHHHRPRRGREGHRRYRPRYRPRHAGHVQ